MVRIWRTRVDADRLDEYERFASERSKPMFEAQQGFRGVLFARAGGACAVISIWRDRDAVEQLENSKSYQQTVSAIVATGLLIDDSSVEVLELHGEVSIDADTLRPR